MRALLVGFWGICTRIFFRDVIVDGRRIVWIGLSIFFRNVGVLRSGLKACARRILLWCRAYSERRPFAIGRVRAVFARLGRSSPQLRTPERWSGSGATEAEDTQPEHWAKETPG